MGGGIRSLRSEGFVGEVNGSCVKVKLVGSGCWKSNEKYNLDDLLSFENENIVFYR